MRHFLFALGLFAAIAGISTGAEAQTYPWCAIYSKGCNSCSFVTRDQCMADVSGIGGFCDPNPQYHPAAAPIRQKSHAHYRG